MLCRAWSFVDDSLRIDEVNIPLGYALPCVVICVRQPEDPWVNILLGYAVSCVVICEDDSLTIDGLIFLWDMLRSAWSSVHEQPDGLMSQYFVGICCVVRGHLCTKA